MGRVDGKVALVSGGARGLGASIAQRLVEEGAKVVLGDVNADQGKKWADALGDAATFVTLDVTHFEQWENAVRTAVDVYGGLDVLVNNAGIVNYGSVDEYTLEDWHQIIAVNLSGTFYGMKAAIPTLKESPGASIINISSAAGLQGVQKLPGYTATKWGVRGLTKAAALDLGQYNIRVNSVHPGLVRTPLTEGQVAPRHVALHRLGEAGELANMVLYLASEESSFSTGSEFVADGGLLAGLASNEYGF